MSDMPMRLKTKMKIILCIFLLYITAVSVFGEPQELNGILGKSIEFPAAVKIDGSLRYNSTLTIGDVISSRFTARNGVSGRLQWDSSTGLFSLSGLKEEDSGVYTVQDTHQNINTVFQLNVYKGNVPVSKPHLSVTRNEYRCTILCATARGTGATLTLYKNGETNPYVTSPGHSHPDLNVTVPVESGTYTCEAKNSVSRETSDPLTVGAHCTAPSSSSAGTIVAIIIAVVAVLIAVVFAVLYWRNRKQLPTSVGRVIVDEANQGLIQDAVGRVIVDKANQGLIQDAVGRVILDKANQGLIQDAVGRVILDKANQGLIQDAVGRVIVDKANQGLIQDAVGRVIAAKTMSELPPDAKTMSELPPDAVRSLIQAVRSLIQVNEILNKMDPRANAKKILDKVSAHVYANTMPELPSYVKKLFDNVDPRACVNEIFDKVDAYLRGNRYQRAEETLTKVKKRLDNVDPHAYAKMLLDNVDPHAYDNANQKLIQDDLRQLS